VGPCDLRSPADLRSELALEDETSAPGLSLPSGGRRHCSAKDELQHPENHGEGAFELAADAFVSG